MINRNIPIPLYYQLMQEFKTQIESGIFKPGDEFLKEEEICRLHGVSRATVRQALIQLVNEGYLRRVKGKGTFVNTLPGKPKFISTLKGFAQEMEEKGIQYSTKVLESHFIEVDNRIAEKLEVVPGSQVFYLKRLRFIQNEPVSIGCSFIPERFCFNIAEIDFEKKSLYDFLEKNCKISLIHGKRNFEASLPISEEERKLLNISPKTPILSVEGLVYTQGDSPVEYLEIKLRGNFSVDLKQL
jgi:GntR family transcriptional regulator